MSTSRSELKVAISNAKEEYARLQNDPDVQEGVLEDLGEKINSLEFELDIVGYRSKVSDDCSEGGRFGPK